MRVDVEYRSFNGSIWLKRGRGPVRKREILKARMRQTVRYGAPWLWE